MAFKNEDIAIHLEEQFEQPTWEAYAVVMAEQHAWKNEQQRQYMAEPERRAHQRQYEAKPEVRAVRNERQRAAHAADPEKRKEYMRAWRAENSEREAARKRAEYHKRNTPEYREAERERQRLMRARKATERLAAMQQVPVNAP